MNNSKKYFLILLIVLSVGALSAFAQEKPARKPVEIAVVEPKAEDVGSIDGIVKAFYEVISGGVGVPRQWSRDKTLYIPDIRFVGMNERNGKPVADVMNHQQYVEGSNDFFVREGFVEKEIKRVVRRFGNMAQVFSSYEFSTAGKQKISGRGLNSIELFSTANAGGFRRSRGKKNARTIRFRKNFYLKRNRKILKRT